MNDKQNAVAKAIADAFGQGDTAYGGNMVDAVYADSNLWRTPSTVRVHKQWKSEC